MAVAVKNLYAGTPGTSSTTLATGAAQGTRVTKILMHNTTASPATITINIASQQVWKRELQPNETVDWSDPCNLNNGQTITAVNTTAGAIKVVVSGYEFT